MSTYLLLAQKARAFRADPRVTEAMDYAGLLTLATPTLDEGETLEAFRKSDSDFDADLAGERDFGFVRLNQLAVEHLTS